MVFPVPNGAMAVNTVIDGRTIGEDGVWVPNEGDTEPANSMVWKMVTWYRTWRHTKKDYTIIAPVRQPLDPRWGNAIRLKGKEAMYSAIQMVNTECYLAYLVLLPSLTAPFLQE